VDPLRPIARTEPAVAAVELTILTPLEREKQRRERERKRRQAAAKPPAKRPAPGAGGLDVRA
jgi:hypothetical protein